MKRNSFVPKQSNNWYLKTRSSFYRNKLDKTILELIYKLLLETVHLSLAK